MHPHRARALPVFLILAALGLLLTQVPERLAAQDPAAQAAVTPNPAFGMCFVTSAEDPASSARLDRAVASGASWDRFPFYWQNIEKSPGQYDFSAQDRAVADDVARGLKTLAILLGTSPVYASNMASADMLQAQRQVPIWPAGRTRPLPDVRIASANSAPANLDRPVFSDGTDVPGPGKAINPDNPWARYVYETVRRYKPGGVLAQARGWPAGAGVSHWEIWNEPDWTFFWSGSVEQYYRLLKVAYLAAKHADPGCTVILGGLATYFDPDWFPRLLQVMSADPNQAERAARNHYFDALAVHFYSRSADALDHTQRARSLLAAHGLNKPIWVTESGVPVWNDYPGPTEDPKSPYRATTEEQAAYVIQAHAYALYSGAQVVFHFQLHDDCGNGPTARDAYGLYRNEASAACYPSDAAPRLSLKAYRTAVAQFRGLQPLWRRTPANDREEIAFYRPQTGHRVTVLWATQGHDVDALVPASGTAASLVDLHGNVTTVTPQGGFYSIRLPRATNQNLPGSSEYMIGGAPYILIESAGRLLSRELIYNGRFAAGLDGWLDMGSTPPALGTSCLSEGKCLLLGSDFVPDEDPALEGGGNSTAYQELLVDAGMVEPTLRFWYRLESEETKPGEDWFELLVVDLDAAGGPTATYLIQPRTTYQSCKWTHASFDLSPWRGHNIRVVFNLYQSSGERPTLAYVDNVSLNERLISTILPLVGNRG
ncbi:MAG: hypothetical protein HPY83_00945 [Anaerolineae bacterium]|nr:hypothetical protein [Anaerolineae bacterium]